MSLENVVWCVLAVLFCVFVLFSVMFVVTDAWASAQCLERGYPKVKVTYRLDAYCVGYDGAVAPKMEKL